jgi:hypothetical protein
MTAEIAILNKMAVALAADSAVTISTGSEQEKIFDSADKLFELSDCNPIGIMLYNGMSFMEIPLPSLIRQFRNKCCEVSKVEDVAKLFLEYLNENGEAAPMTVKNAHVIALIRPIIAGIMKRFKDNLEKHLEAHFTSSTVASPPDINTVNINEIAPKIMDEALEFFETGLSEYTDASFVGGGSVNFSKTRVAFIRTIIDRSFPKAASVTQRGKAVEIIKKSLKCNFLSQSRTGIVVAGFGRKDLFPTLVSYEIDGMVFGKLKYIQTNNVDIDRSGPRARVIPFAQKEMVERFLYGLDEEIESDVTEFCKETVTQITTQIFEMLDFPNDSAKTDLEAAAKKAEKEFIDGLSQKAFEKIRSDSRAEIEDMVEFMPKPELATMAEALVNLTSIKRRVSRGMETVGGPIDVAVISESEGFVWVKRKHYFPQELNARYFSRVNQRLTEHLERAHEEQTPRSVSETKQRRPARRPPRPK